MPVLHIHFQKEKEYFLISVLSESIILIPAPRKENKGDKNHTIAPKCAENLFDMIQLYMYS